MILLIGVPPPADADSLHEGSAFPVIGEIPLDPLDAESTVQATNRTPAPLGSAAVMAFHHGKHDSDAMIAAQKDLQNPEIFIDASNNLIGVEHYEAPDCLPCRLRKGTAVLSNDAMPMGGFNILGDPNQKIYWGR